MKCSNCGGRLEGRMLLCPYCGVRQEIDLRQINTRDLGEDENLPCPDCRTPLRVIEINLEPKLRIERCNTCHGLFFNPGELETLLDAQTHPLVWLDQEQLDQLSEEFGFDAEIVYRRCPVCSERMNRVNFGGRSGVVLDHCGTHGVWLDNGELHRLKKWWHAGGKLIYQQHESERVRRLYGTPDEPRRQHMSGTTETPQPDVWGGFPGMPPNSPPRWLTLIDFLISLISL